MMGWQTGDQRQLFYLFNLNGAFRRAISCAGGCARRLSCT
jgi:hypothetical protein